MSTQTTDKLVIQMSLDMAKLQNGLRQADASIKRFASGIQTTIGAALDLIAIKMVTTLGKDLVTEFASTGAKLEFLSQKTGESVTTLDKWGVAAAKAGGSAEGFYNTIISLQSKLQSAKFGGDPKTMGIFSFLGINPQDNNGKIKKTTELLLELSSKMKGMSRDKQQWIGAQLGIDDATLRILAKGRDETEKFVKAQNALWDDKKAEKAVQAQNRLIDLNRKIEQLKLNIGEKLLPIMYRLADWLTKFIDRDVPKLMKAFDDWSKRTGITAGDIAKLITGLMGLSLATTIILGLATAFTTLGTAISIMLGPVGLVISGLTAVYELYKKTTDLNEQNKIKNYAKTKQDSGYYKFFKKLINTSNSEYNPINWIGKKLSEVKDEVLDWAQGMVESGNKSKIGYKQKKDAMGNYQYVLDSQGNRIPEAYGKYQIRPETAREVDKNATASKLMDNSYNEVIHKKLMDKWEKQFGSKDAALAYYNGGNNGLNQFKQTGTTEYLDKIKAFAFGKIPDNINSSKVNNTSTNKTNNQNITISKVELHGVQNKDQLINELLGHKVVSPALAFSNGRIS